MIAPAPVAAIRPVAIGAYTGVFLFAVWRWGVPFERVQVVAWATGFLAVSALGSSLPRYGRLVRDWLVLAVLFLLYDLTRGLAPELGFPLQTRLPIRIDEWLFFGEVPTVRLQRHLGPFRGDRWWEVVIAITYVSHFIVPYALTAALWFRSRPEWRRWIARFTTLTVAGLATYLVLPTTPPWLAAREGFLPPLQRSAGAGWRRVGLDIAERVLDTGQATVNLTAALPSLHAAYPLLIAGFFWSRSTPVVRILLATYPLLMGFTLVVSAEHYVTDILLGWLYAGAVLVVWQRLDRRPRVARWLAS